MSIFHALLQVIKSIHCAAIGQPTTKRELLCKYKMEMRKDGCKSSHPCLKQVKTITMNMDSKFHFTVALAVGADIVINSIFEEKSLSVDFIDDLLPRVSTAINLVKSCQANTIESELPFLLYNVYNDKLLCLCCCCGMNE